MTPERWAQVNDVLQRALQIAPPDRPAFLDQACKDDDELRREVATLLSASDQAGSSFLQSSQPVGLMKGTKLGDYEVQSLLGSGGMGEVYRARDLRLRREVAIKVLPQFVSSNPQRLRRFEQEALATAALNHPNILAVYQMGSYEGTPYLVTELLEGETLREKIRRGRIAVHKVIDYALQVARGLIAAHEKGIVHRDLKPDNIFVTKDGRIKILDFGLAKLTQAPQSSQHSSPTLGSETEPGMVMGTAGYMAPEQVRGEAVDHRADVFAFGAVLYEMLTGQRAFQKPTSVETMTAILNEEPAPIPQVAPQIPLALQRVVARCLQKHPAQRFQSASDLAFALDALSDSGSLTAASTELGRARSKRKRYLAIAGLGLITFLLAGGAFYYLRPKHKLTERDTVVLADFDNKTGDAVFDDTLRQAMSATLRQSPFLNVLSDHKISSTLQLMTRPPNTRLTPDVVTEVCQRADGKAWIGGSINAIGKQYILEVKAVNCQNGDTLAQERGDATSKEAVLDALGQAATKLRRELGESLASVQKFDVPLTQATTVSLEALKAETLGSKALHEQGTHAAIPFYQHAIELDPNFADAYASLGKMYSNLRQDARAEQFFTKAYSLRQHSSEHERFDIESMYEMSVTRDLEKASRVFQEWLNSYPRDPVALGNLGIVYTYMGQHQRAAELYRQSLNLSVNDVVGYEDVAMSLTFLNQFQEAHKTIQAAFDRKLDDESLHYILSMLAFLENDTKSMAEQEAWYDRKPEAVQAFFSFRSSAETYFGHAQKAREWSRRAVEAARTTGDNEGATSERMRGILSEVALGNQSGARQTTLSILAQSAADDETAAKGALVLAKLGDAAAAESVLTKLSKRSPQDTLVQFVVLPTVRAQSELAKNNPDRTIELLQPSIPYENTSVSFHGCLYPVYVRGEAHLAARHGAAAAVEFQKILDHRGLAAPCETVALAHLGLARALVIQGNMPQAKSAYEDFLTLWKDADPGIPILKEAKVEYSHLH